MKSPIDHVATAQFFMDARKQFGALLQMFSHFRVCLQASGEKNGFSDWKVSGLAANGRSFELEYLSLKVRAVLTLGPEVDHNGVITFYRLDDFDAAVASKIDSLTFDADDGSTDIKHGGGAELLINVERHAQLLMLDVLQTAYLAEGDAG